MGESSRRAVLAAIVTGAVVAGLGWARPVLAQGAALARDQAGASMLSAFILGLFAGASFVAVVLLILRHRAGRRDPGERAYCGGQALLMSDDSRSRPLSVAELARTAEELERQLLEARDTKSRLEAQAGETVRMAEALAEARDRATENERRYRVLAESCPIGIWQVSTAGETLYTNPALVAIFGPSGADEFRCGRYDRILTPESLESLKTARARWTSGARASCEIRLSDETLQSRDIELSGTPLLSESGALRSILVTLVDITERKQAEETIWQAAHSDPLTGLPNRQLFRDRLETALQNAARQGHIVALFFLDIDLFKEVNDTFGHPVGDALLKEISGLLCGAVRESDTVARLGGDEFAIVLTRIEQLETVRLIAGRIVEQLSQPRVIDNCLLKIGTSIGISFYPQDDTNPDELVRKADLALYQAKQNGRGCYHLYDEALHTKVTAQVALENDMRLALVRGEFELYYQPQVSVDGLDLVGAEALVRWRHPSRGLISPDEFIPVAEASGLMIPLGEWVLRTACAQNKAWQDAGLPCMRVAVNISAMQFRSDGLIPIVERALADTGLDPWHLELEITESMVIHGAEEVIERLAGLRAVGVETAIDDFGTGYSSLSYLKRFPLNRLKVDRSFVQGLMDDKDDKAIVMAVILLAHSLGLQVIAEGAETEGQVDALRAMACDEIQGYFFSRPLAADDFAQWAARHRAETRPADAVEAIAS